MKHVDEITCLLYLEGQLERERALELSGHVDECGNCRTLLRALESESRLLSRALVEEDETVPARLLAAPGKARDRVSWAWIVTLGLAATAVYVLWTGYIEPWRQQLEQAGFGGSNLLNILLFQGAFWKGWQSMIGLFEILAMTTLGGVAIVLLRRRFRRWSAPAMILAVIAIALSVPSAASAAEIRKGQSVVVTKDEVIKNDLIFAGKRLRIDGNVEGDVIAFGEVVELNGHVTGDLLIFARSLRVNGDVDGNIRSATNNSIISGKVGKNVTSFLDVLTIDSNGKVGGSLTVFGESVSVDGGIKRDLLAFAGQTILNGSVGGNMKLRGAELTIGPTAEIKGTAVYEEGRRSHKPDVSAQAKLASPLEIKLVEHREKYNEPGYYLWKIIWAGAAFLLGLVLILLMPRFAAEVVGAMHRYGSALGVGLVMWFGVLFSAAIACVTIVGLALGIGTIGLWLLVNYLAKLIVGAWLGEIILGRSRDTGSLVARMAAGLPIVAAAMMVPKIGMLVHFLVWIWGLGAVSLAIYNRLRPASVSQTVPV
jgi:cytoskeletal protein CcmA (bactofilin family)